MNLAGMTLDGTANPLEVDDQEVKRFYQPLAQFLLAWRGDRKRILVGIAGPPACGKSVFTQLLCAVLNHLAQTAIAVHVGLDGWHFPNSYLDSHTILRDGSAIPLRKVKGSPPSFDTHSMQQFLRAVQSGQNPAFPVYSRTRHDPQPGGQILDQHQLVLVEGNYLLLGQTPWTEFQKLFDLTVFLTAPREFLIEAGINRHLRGGKSTELVQAHMAFSDLPNIDLVMNHSIPGDILIRKLDSRRIMEIIFPESGRHMS